MKYPVLLLVGFTCFWSCAVPSSQKKEPKQGQDQGIVFSLRNDLPMPNQGGHVQGVQPYRHQGKGYLFFSGSSQNHSYLAIADEEGKRFLSTNKLLDEPLRHAGGLQIWEDLLAVGIEDNHRKDRSLVQVYRILDPVEPRLQLLKTVERQGAYKRYTSGCVALTEYEGDYLLLVGNWDTRNLDLYTLAKGALDDPGNHFQFADSLEVSTLMRHEWVEKAWYPYQNLNFYRDSAGKLHLAGMALDESKGEEVLDLFAFSWSGDKMTLHKYHHQRLPRNPKSSFKWGGGISSDAAAVFACGKNIEKVFWVQKYPLEWEKN
jgi:hypothetical protein